MDKRLLVLAFGMFAIGTDGFVMAGVLPQIAHFYDVGIGAAGQVTTAYALSFALLAPTVAAIAGNVPRKTLMLLGMTVFVAANLATAVAPTFGVAILMRVITGLGAAMFAPTASGVGAMIVAPERRGFALSIIIGGLTTATALGSPLGSVIGGVGDWRWTMIFVSALGVLAFLGVLFLLSNLPMLSAVSLARRLAPLADARILLTLLTTMLAMGGNFTVYTYFSVVFDRAIGGNPLLLGILLVVWGASGTIGNLVTGRIVDRLGVRKVLLTVMILEAVDMALFAWTGAVLWTAVLAIAIWGLFAWSIQAPQQSRLVSLAPTAAPIVLGLNNSGTYLGVTTAGILGAAGVHTLGAHHLGAIGVALILLALATCELATWRITAANRTKAALATT
ncbi:MFS transporter [Nitrospirillum sp. BR 11163]|uniref:MFS transporter n=1 Tax=Nitrospirillum sp. BR 11163 TaxID=3104323 RepID=UPI002AFF237C|nr:MFS transporter [Nitrospirillum sp. BR 11163]MEA1672839.1 MFS transporter [Nitrospirillum sp. BR 11163]